ncbi:MAG TPA: hypothetical protein VK660_08935, partial [Xanthomonadaceae bacterium]|nr:hypothetical protein [Xanthomonadaceae bacterium]
MGRNRAYQIQGIVDGSEATLKKVVADFAAAQESGLIDMVSIEANADDMADTQAAHLGTVAS